MPTVVEVWKQQGRDEGVQQGMQQGVQQERISVAKQMLNEGFDLAVISKVTKLSIERIQQIKKSLH